MTRHSLRGRTALAMICTLAFVSCAQKAADESNQLTAAAPAPPKVEQGAGSGSEAQRPPRMLAYEHEVAVEITKEVLPERIRDVQKLCAADAQSGCTILDVEVATG